MRNRISTTALVALLGIRLIASLAIAPEFQGDLAGYGLVIRLLQAVSSVGAIWLMYLIARDFSPRAAWFTLAAGVAYPPLLLAPLQQVTEPIFAGLVMLVLFLMHRWVQTRRWGHAAAAGAAVAASYYVNPTFGPWPLVAVPIILLSSMNRDDALRTVKHLAIAALVAAACMSPMWLFEESPAVGFATRLADDASAESLGDPTPTLYGRVQSAVAASVEPFAISKTAQDGTPYRVATWLHLFLLALFGFGVVLMPKLLRGEGAIDHRDHALSRLSELCAPDDGTGAPGQVGSDVVRSDRPDNLPGHHALAATTSWLLTAVAVYFIVAPTLAQPSPASVFPGVPALIVVGAIGLDELLSRLRAPHV